MTADTKPKKKRKTAFVFDDSSFSTPQELAEIKGKRLELVVNGAVREIVIPHLNSCPKCDKS